MHLLVNRQIKMSSFQNHIGGNYDSVYYQFSLNPRKLKKNHTRLKQCPVVSAKSKIPVHSIKNTEVDVAFQAPIKLFFSFWNS